ncbi:MAG: hypothetical protein ACR2GA_06800, partial [Chloroflexota bacterium]
MAVPLCRPAAEAANYDIPYCLDTSVLAVPPGRPAAAAAMLANQAVSHGRPRHQATKATCGRRAGDPTGTP